MWRLAVLYYLFYVFKDVLFFDIELFKYITFRAAFAAITSFLIGIIFGPRIIRALKARKFSEKVAKKDSEQLTELHKHKAGTPTMGGLILLLAIVPSVLLWGDIANNFVLTALIVILWTGFVGFLDDYVKLTQQKELGLSKRNKILLQVVISLFAALVIYYVNVGTSHGLDLAIPFFKNFFIPLGIFYVLFVVVVMVGSSNAVNLSDGLDGLAIGCLTIAGIAFGVIAYIVGHKNFSDYLFIYHIPGSGELAVIAAAFVGAGLSFLWFNSFPAEVFMGDTGALPMGAIIGYIAVVTKQELTLFVVGGVFVAEAVSVILQVLFYKKTGKRLFLIAPLHHHYQFKGMQETKITTRFYIVAAILAVLSIAMLKLR